MADRGLHFVGAGISGGEEGALNGPSIMPGGPKKSYESLGPLLEEISAHVDGVPCCTHIGPDGSGHFVKMVHNGIEYSDMQLIGEAYQLLRDGLGMSAPQIADVFTAWNKGELESYLIEITAEVLKQVDAKTGKPLVDVIVDAAEQKGTGRWTVKSALDLGVPVTGIAEAVFARALSGSKPQRAASVGFASGQLGEKPSDAKQFVEDVRQALYASRSWPTPRGSTRSRRAAPSTAGTSALAIWPPFGVAAASSARSSSIGSKKHSPIGRTWPR